MLDSLLMVMGWTAVILVSWFLLGFLSHHLAKLIFGEDSSAYDSIMWMVSVGLWSVGVIYLTFFI
tara:strand:- start:336 stop:530 length:195 start_codon:yes stop_codon:yes gene_type:complete